MIEAQQRNWDNLGSDRSMAFIPQDRAPHLFRRMIARALESEREWAPERTSSGYPASAQHHGRQHTLPPLKDCQPAAGRNNIARAMTAKEASMSSLDFLSYVLSFLRVNSSSLFIFDLTEPWGIETAEVVVPISLTVTQGHTWLVIPDRDPVLVESGDTILLPRGSYGINHALLSSLDVHAEDVGPLLKKLNVENLTPGAVMARPTFVSTGGGGPLTRIVSATFGFDVHRLGPLMAALPELMVVRSNEKEKVFIDTILGNLLDVDPDLPGFAAMAAQTAQLLLIHVVRAFALTGRTDDIGWLAGLAAPGIARALTSIHQDPGRDWNVALLARIAGLSRSSFAAKFHERLGQTPMHYLRSWRMHLAQEALAATDVTVTTLTQNLGYQSEAAFREAFRQATGKTPKEFRRQHPSRLRPAHARQRR